MPNLPSVIYIGFQKTGSAFLRSYFDAHPRIRWTRHAGLLQNAGLDIHAYRSLFENEPAAGCLIDMNEGLALGHLFRDSNAWHADCALRAGCAIDGVAMEPSSAAVAANIRGALNDVRILITIRNQVDWIRSNYLHYILNLEQGRRSFRDFRKNNAHDQDGRDEQNEVGRHPGKGPVHQIIATLGQ